MADLVPQPPQQSLEPTRRRPVRKLRDLERLAISGSLFADDDERRVAREPEDSGLLFRDYAHALHSDGIALMAGSLGVLFAFLAAYFAFIAQHSIAILWLLSCLSIAVASYRVWVKERRRLLAERQLLLEEKAKNAKPELRVEVLEVYSYLAFPLGQQSEQDKDKNELPADRFFTIRARVFNVRQTPTTLRFELWVQPPNANCKTSKSSVDGLLFKYEKHTTAAQGDRISKTETVTEEMRDLETECRTPLVFGEGREGWLRFVLQKATNPMRQDIELITLAIKDSYGGTKVVSVPPSEWRTSGEFVTKSNEAHRKARERVLDRAFQD